MQSVTGLFYIVLFYNSINYLITVVIEIARIINQANPKEYTHKLYRLMAIHTVLLIIIL